MDVSNLIHSKMLEINKMKKQLLAFFMVSCSLLVCASEFEADMLRVLPALPADWSTGEFHDMLTRAGVRTSAQWDMTKKEIKLSLVAERDTAFDIKFPEAIAELTCSQPEILKASKFGKSYRRIRLEKGHDLAMQVKLK